MSLESSNTGISIGDSPSIDSFGRLRTSHPKLVFESIQKYDKQPLFWDEQLTGSATSTHAPNQSSTQLTCTTASGDKVVRQTKHYFPYSPGRSHFIMLTGNFGGHKTGVRQRIGYFDSENGLFVELSGGTAYVVRRTFTSGVAVDNAVAQSSWNVDKMDGTGPSGITLDFTKTQIIVIDFEWLGVGRVRMGWCVDGLIHYCHYFLNANNLDVPYMTTAKLPCRYEIENTSGTASSTTMLHTCVTVMSEGGEPTGGTVRSIARETTGKSTTSNKRAPIISIRLKSANIRATLQMVSWSMISSSTNDVYYEWVLNPALSGASWVADAGYAEYDLSATAVSITGSNCVVIDSGYFSDGAGVNTVGVANNALWIGATIGGTSDIYTLCATPLGTGPTMYAAITFREIV